MLVNHNANMYIQNNKGLTPEQFALTNKSPQIINLFIQLKKVLPSYNMRNYRGEIPHYAQQNLNPIPPYSERVNGLKKSKKKSVKKKKVIKKKKSIKKKKVIKKKK
jgi:hypothetical protein